ncbi:hypothetical protein DFH29DRAFT_880163 [Suillus ampliporus]|nr:hypothetical protein DFH29DRAFT_880334 [Suillus ampliporus]KAG0695291.1 hypothetical protein DFH29DRAFT_880163 [Suillus ampliporus]
MAPHIHVTSSRSTEGNATSSIHANMENALNVYTGGRCSDATNVRPQLAPDIQIHQADIAHFVETGFDEEPAIIKDIYTHVKSFRETKRVVKVMRLAAMEAARVEIQRLKNEARGVQEDSDSEGLYERPEKAKADPKEEENE